MKVAIIGGSYLGVGAAAIISRISGLQFIGFIDDSPEKMRAFCDHEILGSTEILDKGLPSETRLVIAIGNNADRLRVLRLVDGFGRGHALISLIDLSAVVLDGCTIERGCVIFPGAVLGPNARIGECTIVGANATIGALAEIGPLSNISPGSNIGSAVNVGGSVHIGIGASVMQCLSIHANAIVGAGAAVVKNIDHPGVFMGIPAKSPSHK